MVSECLRKRGSELLSDVKPSALCLASSSTLSCLVCLHALQSVGAPVSVSCVLASFVGRWLAE